MTFTLPTALQVDDDESAVHSLIKYFGPVVGAPDSYTGAAWDDWDPSGRRAQDPDDFTSDDCMAGQLSDLLGERLARDTAPRGT